MCRKKGVDGANALAALVYLCRGQCLPISLDISSLRLPHMFLIASRSTSIHQAGYVLRSTGQVSEQRFEAEGPESVF